MSTYNELYKFQNKVLFEIGKLDSPFYLTGGTALSRFYLNHRWSDDLDFFVNRIDSFSKWIERFIQTLKVEFQHESSNDLFTEDYFRCFLSHENLVLKLEFVNDVVKYVGNPQMVNNFKIDNVQNILCNKLTALIGRDEPKDVFDIVCISLNYSFNWKQIFLNAKEKSLMNELDILERMTTFPVELFKEVKWRTDLLDLTQYTKWIDIIATDFSLGNDNSLGVNKVKIEDASPNLNI
jgi:predicted nucleotidyltransferase component of viral defense system